MTTKTDFHAIQELREKYTPKVRGIVSGEEAKTIKGVQAVDKSAEYLDAMSAITCVIDHEKFKRGMGV